MNDDLCLCECVRCGGVCRKGQFHQDDCSCGISNCQWMASDFPPDVIIDPAFSESERPIVTRSGKRKIKITCEFCKKEFEFFGYSSTKKYCSQQCISLKTRQNATCVKHCKSCLREFSCLKSSKKKTCSKECASKANWASSRQHEKWTKVKCFSCEIVIDKLRKKVNTHNFCSSKCRSRGMSLLHQTHKVKSNKAKGIKRGVYRTIDGREIKYDSSYELRRMRELDYSEKNLEKWERCNFSIPWVSTDGNLRNYNPDFFLEYKDGTVVIEEVKGRLDEESLLKVAAGRKFCETKGWKFQIYSRENFVNTLEVKTKIYTNDFGSFSRPTLEWVFMSMALQLAERSTCLRKKVGVVFTDSRMLWAPCLGYNGDESGGRNQCESLEPGKCNCIHAEINALTKNNFDIAGGICFVTLAPCRLCAKVLINRQIKRVIYYESYRNSSGIQLLLERGVEVIKFSDLEDSFDDTL